MNKKEGRKNQKIKDIKQKEKEYLNKIEEHRKLLSTEKESNNKLLREKEEKIKNKF